MFAEVKEENVIINKYLLSHKLPDSAALRFMAITVVFSVSDISYSGIMDWMVEELRTTRGP